MTSAKRNDFFEHSQNLSSQKWKFCFDLSALIRSRFQRLGALPKSFFSMNFDGTWVKIHTRNILGIVLAFKAY